jgi:hypothetical protein
MSPFAKPSPLQSQEAGLKKINGRLCHSIVRRSLTFLRDEIAPSVTQATRVEMRYGYIYAHDRRAVVLLPKMVARLRIISRRNSRAVLRLHKD